MCIGLHVSGISSKRTAKCIGLMLDPAQRPAGY
jgi:hypothetical protein